MKQNHNTFSHKGDGHWHMYRTGRPPILRDHMRELDRYVKSGTHVLCYETRKLLDNGTYEA